MADQDQQPVANEPKKGGYGKRPIWQWVLIYLVVGGIIYYGVWYFALKGDGGYGTGGSQTQTSPY